MESDTRAVEQVPPLTAQQENAEGTEDEEIINVDDEKPLPPAVTTAPDGTMRVRRQQQTPKAPSVRSGPFCCSGGSGVVGIGTTVVDGIAVGRMFPFLGDPEATWANAEETVKAEIGGPYPLRRNNRQKLFRSKDEHERRIPNRWCAVRIECAQAGAPILKPLSEDTKKRRKTSSSKKISCNWKVVFQWPQRSPGPYISQVHLTHDTALEGDYGGKVHPPPKVLDDEISKEEVVDQEDKIKELVDAGFGTTDLHKYLQRGGKPLGVSGRQKVRAIRRKHLDAKAASSEEQDHQQQQPKQPKQRQQQQRPPHPQPRLPVPPALQPPPPVLQPPVLQAPALQPPVLQPPVLQLSQQPQASVLQQAQPPRLPQAQRVGGPSPPPPLPVTSKPFGLASTIPAPSPSGCVGASPNGGGACAGPPAASGGHANGGPLSSSLEASKLADCIAFGKELASIAAGVKSRDALDRVIAHARMAAETAVKVEVRCQGRRADTDAGAGAGLGDG